MNTQAYVNIEYVVASVLNEIDDDERDFERLLQLAIEGYSNDLNLSVMPSIKTIELIPDDINTVALPPDFVDYTAIGYESDGRIYTFTNDNKIKLPTSFQCGDLKRTNTTGSDDVNEIYSFSGYYSDASSQYIKYYGQVGGHNSTYYRIDLEHGRIIMLGNTPSKVILEYVSSGVGDGAMVVPRRAVPALKNYVHWKRINYSREYSMGEKNIAKNEYIAEKMKLFAANHAFTMDEYLDDKYKTMKQTPKI
jgi:hypothetical protein